MLPFNFNHLYYFYIVAKHGNVSRAAQELHISQSSISIQIKQLETALGHTLFNRVKTGVELTDSGHIVFQYAEDVFADVDRVRNALDAIEHRVRGSLMLGTVNSIGIYMLPELLKEFNAAYPEVKVAIEFKPPRELIDQARAGKMDFVILTSNRQYAGVTGTPLRKNKMFLVAPPEHPLAKSDRIELSDLERYPFLGFEEGMESRSMMDALFKRMAIRVEYVMESSNVATIKHIAMAGLGLAILPEQAVAPELRQGTLVRLPVPSLYLTQEITAYHKTNRTLTPAKVQFLKVLQRGGATEHRARR